MRRQYGMTLLEAIVALTLMALGAMALFAWLGTSAHAVDRAAERDATLGIERSALAVVETINPMAEPRGERTIGALRVSWSATALGPVRPGRGPGGPITVFDVALYALDVRAEAPNGGEVRFEVRRLGWVTARTMEPQE
jgi:general secretion pathway protein I